MTLSEPMGTSLDLGKMNFLSVIVFKLISCEPEGAKDRSLPQFHWQGGRGRMVGRRPRVLRSQSLPCYTSCFVPALPVGRTVCLSESSYGLIDN